MVSTAGADWRPGEGYTQRAQRAKQGSSGTAGAAGRTLVQRAQVFAVR